jgi:hypothetical protein
MDQPKKDSIFQLSGIECLIKGMGKPELLFCFNQLPKKKKEEFIGEVARFAKETLTGECKQGRSKIEELQDTNSI